MKFTISKPKFVGKMPLRQDLEVLPKTRLQKIVEGLVAFWYWSTSFIPGVWEARQREWFREKDDGLVALIPPDRTMRPRKVLGFVMVDQNGNFITEDRRTDP